MKAVYLKFIVHYFSAYWHNLMMHQTLGSRSGEESLSIASGNQRVPD